MTKQFKIVLLAALKRCGLFRVVRFATRRQLRILCYHGISIGDQHEYAPILFMRAETFERRMKMLVAQGWRIVDLDTAVEELRAGRTIPGTVVLTIDDGWLSTLTEAAPILAALGIPGTVYVTTYYAERPADVFNVALYYMLWKTQVSCVTLRTGYGDLDGTYDLTSDGAAAAAAGQWTAFAENNLTWQQRQELLRRIARDLELDPDEVLGRGRFRLMSSEQVGELASHGLDAQLHTHRHRSPRASFEAFETEVLENKKILEDWTGKPCEHFCYPSGEYSLKQSEWLTRLGIRSATTCDAGGNPVGSHPQRLRRTLDRESWTDLEFEAALLGIGRPGKMGARRE